MMKYVLTGIAILLCAAFAQGNIITLGFDCITNNSRIDAAIGENQFFMQVSKETGAKASFTFFNVSGGRSSAITEIYFDGNVLKKLVSIKQLTSQVCFKTGSVTPPNLPGGNGIYPPFEAVKSLSVAAKNPSPKYGINPGEQIKLVYTLNGAFDDVVAALIRGDLRIGLHAQAFCNGGSESFVNCKIPELGSLAAISLGLLFLNLK